MSKLYQTASGSWWVPESNPVSLAVRLSVPELYREAVLAKVRSLVEKAGGEDKALALVNPRLEDLTDISLEPGVVDLAEQLLGMDPLASAVWEADPARDQLADPEMCKAAIAAQEEVGLLELLQ